MKDQLKWVLNHMPKSDDQHLDVMSLPNVAKARSFHGSFPQYSITPLAQLDGMAQYLGLAGVYVKDESYRFGLNAFKVLGGSFAMARYIAGEMGRDVSEMNYSYLTSEAFRKEFGQATFFTATDGNHGRGVAWAANKLGQKSVVHMPKGSSKSRFDNIAKEGAKVTIEEVNYDDCVRMAAAEAAQTEHGVIVQDTAWDGYEEIPSWIMQGYGTMASEAAVLGTHALYVNTIVSGSTREQSERFHLMDCFNEGEDRYERAAARAEELLATPGLKEIGLEKQKKLLSEKVDINGYYMAEMDRLAKAGRKG